MSPDYNWRREQDMPPTVIVAPHPRTSRLRLGAHVAGEPTQDQVTNLVHELWGESTPDDARCVYRVGVIIEDITTREQIRPGERNLGGAKGRDWARVMEAFKSISSDQVSCTGASWQADNGCAYDHGSWGALAFFAAWTNQPVTTVDHMLSNPKQLKSGEMGYLKSSSDEWQGLLDSTGLGTKIQRLLSECMSGGGEFDLVCFRVDCLRNLTQPEQSAMLSSMELLDLGE